MLKNHFNIAWRSLLKNKASSFINISGLSTGMVVAMLIGCWIYNEWSFDRQFTHYNSIAQAWAMSSGHKGAQNQLQAPVADELRAKFGNYFKQVVLSSKTMDCILALGQKQLIKAGNFMEPNGLQMLDPPMLQGNFSSLNDPHSILLSASLAKAFFAAADPMGQVLHLNDSLTVKVTGVYKDFPRTSSFSETTFLSPWDLYASFDGETRHNRHSWGDNNWWIFVQLAPHTDMASASAKIKNIRADNDPWIDSTGHNHNTSEVFLHPMSRWHLYSEFRDGDDDTGRIQHVRLFGLIGVLVLLLACINFMNLSTARSEKRAKEVGIRKTIGSRRSQLVAQFFTESLLVAALALLIALGMVQISLPWFNKLADTQMSIPWLNPLWWVACIGFSLFTGLIAGSYPALYLSSFQPIKVLKGVFRMGRLAALPRKILVVMQFTVSVAMIIGTIVVFRQVQYGKDRPVGYERQGLLMTQLHTLDIYKHFSAFRSDLLRTGAIADVAESVSPVTVSWPFNGGLTWTGHSHWDGEPDFSMKGVTKEYANTIGLQFVQGRDFRTDTAGADAKAMILNESTVKYMKLKDPIGTQVTWGAKQYTVIGVVKDMVMESPYESSIPAIFYLANWRMADVTMRINPQSGAQDALRRIAPVFAKYNPAEPFDYKFADEAYDGKFRTELQVGRLAGFFTILAIFISCLGLFGLASYIAEQRTKEIGLRKVLGASIFNLWKLLSKDFIFLTSLSCMIAVPVAAWLLHQWLQQFVYKTDMAWWIFAAAVLGALIITILTVSLQAIKAASANPVKSLRTE